MEKVKTTRAWSKYFKTYKDIIMARTKSKIASSKAEFFKNWVWCPAGSGRYIQHRKWIHYKTCEVRQSIKANKCPVTCRWYHAVSKLCDPRIRRAANIAHAMLRVDQNLIQKELLNKKQLKKYFKSIPKEA